MKKGLVFLLGLVVGIILTLVVAYFIGTNGTSDSPLNDPGVSLMSEPGETLRNSSFKIVQVMPNGTALAESKDEKYSYYSDPIVFFLPEEGVSYYDDQIINVPENKVARQIGTYQYKTRVGMGKTVPIVKFLDK